MMSMLNLPNRRLPMADENGIDMGQQQEMPSFLDAGQQQPDRPTYGQSFRAGFGQTQGGLRNKLLGGLAGYAGGGGFGGAVGNVARFLL